MECVKIEELTGFLLGELEPGRLIEVDDHLRSCEGCRARLVRLPTRAHVIGGFGAELLGVADCPEYEELSEFVDGSLDSDSAKAITAHLNACELCSADVERITELRGHAELRETIKVQPGIKRRASGWRIPVWQKALAGATALAAIVAVVIVTSRPPTQHSPGQVFAVKDVHTQSAPDVAKPQVAPTQIAQQKPETPKPTLVVQKSPQVPPKPAVLVKDGSYGLIKRGGRVAYARSDGNLIRTPLEAKIDRLIAQKIASGKIKPAQTMTVAMNTIQVRTDDGFAPSPAAPKPVSPSGVVLMSDRPVFTWTRVDLADSYRLVVTDSKGNVVFDKTTDKTSLSPGALDRGQAYIWRVGVRFSESDEWASSSGRKFGVLSSDDYSLIQSVKRTMPGSHLALGAVYESLGFSDEAAREYSLVRKANPGSSLARKLR